MPEHCHSALLTDLYELTMAAAYFDSHFEAEASFELFVRALPENRSYLIAAGLEQALDFLQSVRFGEHDIEYLRQLPVFRHISADFFEYLRKFRFTGEVWAIPEGTPVFSEEPLLRVTAPIIEGRIVDTFLLSTLTFQTIIASKAARVVEAAQGRAVVEFGTRRALGATGADIFFQTVLETAALALTGGTLGLVISWPTSHLISKSVALPFAFDQTNAVFAFIVSTSLNLIFSFLPSHKAASVSPIEALRHE